MLVSIRLPGFITTLRWPNNAEIFLGTHRWSSAAPEFSVRLSTQSTIYRWSLAAVAIWWPGKTGWKEKISVNLIRFDRRSYNTYLCWEWCNAVSLHFDILSKIWRTVHFGDEAMLLGVGAVYRLGQIEQFVFLRKNSISFLSYDHVVQMSLTIVWFSLFVVDKIEHPSGIWPIFKWGNSNVTSSWAKTISKRGNIETPNPAMRPLTPAISGFSKVAKVSMNLLKSKELPLK